MDVNPRGPGVAPSPVGGFPWESPAREEDLARLGALLAACVAAGASDLHVAPGRPPLLRVHGELREIPGEGVLTADGTAIVVRALLSHCGGRGLLAHGSQDGAFTTEGGGRFRFNVFRRQGGVAAAIRRLEDSFRTLPELGLPASLYGLCDLPDGLVVVAGPTGAGKSTTLAALVDRINRTRTAHVVTIEDPVEYVHVPVRSLVNQRQVGADTPGFHEALVASLREDPDVIVVGEIRDLETIRTAIRAAETGHLVLTTVHAGDCVGAVERLVAVFPADEQTGIRQQLSLVLRAIVAQHLLPEDGPRADGGTTAPRPQDAAAPDAMLPGTPARRGRVLAAEILVGTPAVAHLVATGRSAQVHAAMEAGGQFGMRTLEEDLARLVTDGRITLSSATLATRNPGIVRDRVAARRPSAGGGPATGPVFGSGGRTPARTPVHSRSARPARSEESGS